MHLADAFIQSDLQCIQAIHFFCQYVLIKYLTYILFLLNYHNYIMFCYYTSSVSHNILILQKVNMYSF